MPVNRPAPPRLSVVMPCFNERRTVRAIVERVLEVPVSLELVVVDDGSTDGTREALADITDSRVRVLLQPENRGKGAAVRAGLREARAPYVVVQDADREYDPMDLVALLAPLEAGEADVVLGTRFPRGRPSWVDVHRLGNWGLTQMTNLATGLALSDVHTCYKMIRRGVLERVRLDEERFGFDAELVLKLARIPGLRYAEVPIGYRPRTRAEGKKIGFGDAVRVTFVHLRYGFWTWPGRQRASALLQGRRRAPAP